MINIKYTMKWGDNIKTLVKWLQSIGFKVNEKYIDYFIDAKRKHNNGSEEWVTIEKDSKGYKCKLYQWVNSDLGRKIEYTANT